MADKVDKPKKKAKAKKDEKGVLAALPSTRPERIGGRRSAAKTASSSGGAKTARVKTASDGADSARVKTAPDEAKSARVKTATRPKAVAPHTFEPTRAAESAATSEAVPTAPPPEAVPTAPPASEAVRDAPRTGPPASEHGGPRPRPLREGAPGIGTGGHRDEPSPESARPSGVELASTAVKAVGEVAQLGLAMGGQVLKRVVDRLPKP